ncbi:single-pass membrane and coiled-coil domain-containing protein 1 [Sceloporus undulatus]|uniref:single-pass membrane and coiled-coil domain-containing protein 1 n=1 Tax=Sceloporus undulatus TaxID=8520 RepID=UPI001C4D34E5|nr:single-pass membrane and coiled-coil domain-containing protein 1 [Sceloporus undulatus]
MTREAISLSALNKTLNRVENKLQTVEAQFTVLDSSIQKLSEKFEFWSNALDHQIDQNEMWTSLLEDRFTSVEVNLFYSYICETIHCLHSQVLRRLPDLARGLPTLSSVLRRKGKNPRIKLALEAALEKLGLHEQDVKILCAFFITHSHDACYYPASQRQGYTKDVCSMISSVVQNQLLQQSLLCAVHVVENSKV